ncbi:MAG TPA: IS630 family transposase [Frankiaceae bacterium]|nr:IS630 family transposase [Frankiaceae bacterium]
MRPPEVFVRSLSHQEATRLKRMSTRAEHQSTRIRAAILLASNVQTPVPQIARMWLTDDSHVRKVIHEFNEQGFDSLRPDYRGGRPRRITAEQRQRVVAVAGARPDTQGVPLTRWSLDRLSAYLAHDGLMISAMHLWRLLQQAGLSFQRTRSWKASPDPDYEARAARVLELYAAQPVDGPVISFDQMGPISLKPIQGAGWAPRTRPERLRATYNRKHGIRYVFGALDVHRDRLWARMRPRRRGIDNLGFMRTIRAVYPARQKLYWIQDNLSANWTADIRAYAAANRIELVPTPTYASYLNRIESHFRPIQEFVFNNTDYPDWNTAQRALADHVTYRNGRDHDRRIAALERRHRVAA